MTAVYTQIMDALLAQLRTGCDTTFKTYSRRFIMWEQMAELIQQGKAPKQPALYLFDGVMMTGGGKINFERTARSVPNKREMERTIVIYAQIPGGGTPAGPNNTTPGGDIFYPLLESVENAIAEAPGVQFGVQTLGGLVSQCWIEGDSYM